MFMKHGINTINGRSHLQRWRSCQSIRIINRKAFGVDRKVLVNVQLFSTRLLPNVHISVRELNCGFVMLRTFSKPCRLTVHEKMTLRRILKSSLKRSMKILCQICDFHWSQLFAAFVKCNLLFFIIVGCNCRALFKLQWPQAMQAFFCTREAFC